ncbi:hypothetical protein FDP41_011372 [Naegleria fowleri]|uniref:Uncharacterized protein n=1 Tax=Naegleria fowleri TaxID=5763 RepID=A0A6A5C6H5_NAEFO|nr:uncharacterized protein FDP41_011372 [Naegleria fowleri]KAF0982442.1 hypothetical protein FDP41_011372 [Naegleria fowleri]CAG4709354.1 unnamed protein product [Naegleria fowleri]
MRPTPSIFIIAHLLITCSFALVLLVQTTTPNENPFGISLQFQEVRDELDNDKYYHQGRIIFNNAPVEDPDELRKIFITKAPPPHVTADFEARSVECSTVIGHLGSSIFDTKTTHGYAQCRKLMECMVTYCKQDLHVLIGFLNQETLVLDIPNGKSPINVAFEKIENFLSKSFPNYKSENDLILLSCRQGDGDGMNQNKPILAANGNVYKNQCVAAMENAPQPFTELSLERSPPYLQQPNLDSNRIPSRRILLRHYLQIAVKVVKFLSNYLKDQCLFSTDVRVLQMAEHHLELALQELLSYPVDVMQDSSSTSNSRRVVIPIQDLDLSREVIQQLKDILLKVVKMLV